MLIQLIPNPDSPNHDAFEAIVELYYQTSGYITSSGKWFWVMEDGKQQRGYQDIDVMAVSGDKLIIVSVTSNLDDKLRKNRNGDINNEMLQKLLSYFERVEQYLNNVEKYKWLCDKKICKVVAYNHAFKNANEIIQILSENEIETISAGNMLGKLIDYVEQPNLKIQNNMLRTIQLLKDNEYIV